MFIKAIPLNNWNLHERLGCWFEIEIFYFVIVLLAKDCDIFSFTKQSEMFLANYNTPNVTKQKFFLVTIFSANQKIYFKYY